MFLDKYGGITETLYEEGENQFIIKSICDIEPVLNEIKYLRETSNEGKSQSGDLYHVAKIPKIFVLRWNREYGVDVLSKENWPLLKRLLESPEFKAFRIYQGKI